MSLLNVDNLQLDGNLITSTNTNGHLVIRPNGTGRIQCITDGGVGSGTGSFRITGATTGPWLVLQASNTKDDRILFQNSGNFFTGSIYRDASDNIKISQGNGSNGTDPSLFTDAIVINSSARTTIADLKATKITIDEGTATLEQLNVDNIQINGNTISSTNTNGDINITPNGSGSVVLAGDILPNVSDTTDIGADSLVYTNSYLRNIYSGINNDLTLTASDDMVLNVGAANEVVPSTDNDFGLGRSGARFADIWAVDGAINTSDVREKKNIIDLNHGLDSLLSMRPVSFEWINPSKSKITKKKNYGFIAQELEIIVPDIVRKPSDYEIPDNISEKRRNIFLNDREKDLRGLKSTDLIPILVNAIKELNDKITRLENELHN